ncbi:trypsin-like peptidase domain-containing protein [Planctomycetota bacterium]|jgi:S1-C subfamily serine protease|nr:trypsin-like peptidase domain-containing protein [Planctomycetota bacterium]
MSTSQRRLHLGSLGLVSAAAGLLAASFGLGQRFAPTQLDPRQAAAQVSQALQTASADAARSVVQVESFRRSRGRLRKILDGSGVVIDESGLVVTNHHVISGASAFRVVFTSGERCDAELLGSDESTDLALLQVTGDRDFSPMPLRTDLPPVGELVLAVGNPLSLGHTVTLGVVNGHGRNNLDIAEYENYIQTDAAINPGNSGGPLVDVEGRAVGITVAVGLASNGDEGLAFAIPSSMVRKVVDEIEAHGRVRRAYLGVGTFSRWEAGRSLRADREAGYTGPSAVKVRSVYPDTPAASAKIKEGDILLAVGSRKLTDSQSFTNSLIEASPEESTTIRLWRDGRVINVSAVLTER